MFYLVAYNNKRYKSSFIFKKLFWYFINTHIFKMTLANKDSIASARFRTHNNIMDIVINKHKKK